MVYSRFVVNLFRHRHFLFIIVSVNKTNLLYKMDFTYMQEVDLRRFLQKRGVSFSFYRKYYLERLYKLAHEMYLEVISKIVDFDTQTISDAERLEIVKQLLNCWK